ncbi:MAG: hypothetical protein WBK77_05050 [Alphaproteobacteria bacterium]
MARAKKKAAAKKQLKNKASSPLIRSAFEVLEHGLSHYLRSTTTKDMRFALLHVDQSIELMLKERVRIGGNSIYKSGGKETISIHAAYESLDKLGVKIPEKNNLELLHEERNSIQHKYLNPTAEDAGFHIENAMKFINRFVSQELNLELSEFIPVEYLDQL